MAKNIRMIDVPMLAMYILHVRVFGFYSADLVILFITWVDKFGFTLRVV